MYRIRYNITNSDSGTNYGVPNNTMVSYTLTVQSPTQTNTDDFSYTFNGSYYVVNGQADNYIDVTNIVDAKLQPPLYIGSENSLNPQWNIGTTLFSTGGFTSPNVNITLVTNWTNSDGSAGKADIVTEAPISWFAFNPLSTKQLNVSANLVGLSLNMPLSQYRNDKTVIPYSFSGTDSGTNRYFLGTDGDGNNDGLLFTNPTVNNGRISQAYLTSTYTVTQDGNTYNPSGYFSLAGFLHTTQQKIILQDQCFYDSNLYYVNKAGGLDVIPCKAIETLQMDRTAEDFLNFPIENIGVRRTITDTYRTNYKLILPPISKAMNKFVDNLFQSPRIWFQDVDYNNNFVIPAIITTTSINKVYGYTQAIQYELNIQDCSTVTKYY